MAIKANLHLTLKLEMFMVNVIEIPRHMYVKFERVIVKSFPTIDRRGTRQTIRYRATATLR